MSLLCPPPVYATNSPVAELRSTAELLLVATLRLFVLPWRDPAAPRRDWRGGFRAAGIAPCAVPAFETLFEIVAVAPRRSLDIRCPRCPRLGADEGRLLQAVSLLQRDRTDEAAALLADWLPPTALAMAMLPAQGLAAAMARQGLIVAWRHAEAATPHRTASAHADPGLLLVQ